MKRQAIGNGSWFNLETAKFFGEETEFDGHNQISVNTGSQWEHEDLYRTAKGSWVLNHWSQYQGTQATWESINSTEAVAWLIKNLHKIPKELSEIASGMEI